MNTARPDLFAAKLAPGVRGDGGIRRAAIEAALQQAAGAKLVLVSGPAGFGKTTTMVQLRAQLEARQVATAWLTLDRADNDIARFLAGLAAAVAPWDAEGRGDPLEVLATDSGPSAATAPSSACATSTTCCSAPKAGPRRCGCCRWRSSGRARRARW